MQTSINVQDKENRIEVFNYWELLKDPHVHDWLLQLAHLGGVRGHPLYERIYYKTGDETPSDAFYEKADEMLMFLVEEIDMVDKAGKSFMVILARLLSIYRGGGKPVFFIPLEDGMSLFF